jgi:hypothetical protein
MRRRKRKSGDWHHRVPDFKMVYCGSKKHVKEEPKQPLEKRMVEVSVTNKDSMTGNWNNKNELKKVRQ